MQLLVKVACGSGKCVVGGACHSECDARGFGSASPLYLSLTYALYFTPIMQHLSRQQTTKEKNKLVINGLRHERTGNQIDRNDAHRRQYKKKSIE